MKEALPLRAEAILKKVRRARGGALYDSRFGERQRGQGQEAGAAQALFAATVKRLGLDGSIMESPDYEVEHTTFRRPPKAGEQLGLL